MTSDADRALLLRIAREAIAAHRRRRSPVRTSPSAIAPAILAATGGAFVTLHKRRRAARLHRPRRADRAARPGRAALRGRRGSADPRFPPLSRRRAATTSTSRSRCSVRSNRSPARRTSSSAATAWSSRRGWRRGLLLPQVATEWGWDAETFLAQTCRKAGLPRGRVAPRRDGVAVRGGGVRRGAGQRRRRDPDLSCPVESASQSPRSVFRFCSSSGSIAIGPVALPSAFGVSSSIGRSRKRRSLTMRRNGSRPR